MAADGLAEHYQVLEELGRKFARNPSLKEKSANSLSRGKFRNRLQRH